MKYFLISLFVFQIGNIFGQTKLIRTFVNGTNKEVTDLHIVYGSTINKYRITRTDSDGQQGRATFKEARFSPRTVVDIVFDKSVPPNGSVNIAAESSKESLSIITWWWTRQGNRQIGPRNSAYIRGDESRKNRRKTPRIDLFSIINKGHHWGGIERNLKNGSKVVITMDISRILKKCENSDEELDNATKQKLRDNITKAIKQWTDCTNLVKKGRVPISGKGRNPKNDGLGTDPPVMGPGPGHKGGAAGEKFRSVTKDECEGIFSKYPRGLEIRLVNDPDGADIEVQWGIPDEYGKKALGVGPSEAAKGNPHKTIKGSVYMKCKPKGKFKGWHYGSDKDGDGYITNMDNDEVPEDRHDFYSVFKHELGHVLCFFHAGRNLFLEKIDFSIPEEIGSANSVHNEKGCCSQAWNEGDDYETEPLFFSSDRPGGYGGYDLYLKYQNEDDQWIIKNLGNKINTPFNEIDPYFGSDGTSLLFASNSDEGKGGYDLYQSNFSLDSLFWGVKTNLGNNINSQYDETHPSLTADMKSLYFSSNREEGFGQFDIYGSELLWASWFSKPYNLGSVINSENNDIDPTISSLGNLLIYSSDRDEGKGAYDLWYSRLNKGWEIPENINISNSNANETSPSISSDNLYVFFSSDRKEEQGSNLYKLNLGSEMLDYDDGGDSPEKGITRLLWILMALFAIILLVFTIRKRKENA